MLSQNIINIYWQFNYLNSGCMENSQVKKPVMDEHV